MGDAPDTWSDHIDEEPEYVQRMVRWFFERYEDPAENTPFESAEGGYQYVRGGPFIADDVLEEQFAAEYQPDEIQRAADFISEWGDEWAPVAREGDDDFELKDDEPDDDEPDDDEEEEEEEEPPLSSADRS